MQPHRLPRPRRRLPVPAHDRRRSPRSRCSTRAVTRSRAPRRRAGCGRSGTTGWRRSPRASRRSKSSRASCPRRRLGSGSTPAPKTLRDRLRGGDFAAERDERLDRMRDEARRLDGARERVRAGRHGARGRARSARPRPRRRIDRPRRRRGGGRPSVRRCARAGRRARARRRSAAAASLIVVPGRRPARSSPHRSREKVAATTPGRLTITTAGSGSTPAFATSRATARSLSALIATNPARAALAAARASRRTTASTAAPGIETLTTTTRL